MSQPRKPIQLVLMDDDGREIFNTYVSLRSSPDSYNIDFIADLHLLGNAMREAMRRPLDPVCSEWITH